MFRTALLVLVAYLVALCPARLMAGGPPWLCLPIDGVTSDSAKDCTQLLGSKLKDKIWSSNEHQGIQLKQSSNQWYLMFYMDEDVTLHEVDAALRDTKYSIPRQKLRLFGHAILAIDPRSTPRKEIVSSLEAMDQVAVAESNAEKKLLLVTIDTAYPVNAGRLESDSIAWEKFQRNDFSTDQSARSPITSRMLPTYVAVQETLAKHNADLKDIRWSTNFACRAQGCVVARDTVVEVSANTEK